MTKGRSLAAIMALALSKSSFAGMPAASDGVGKNAVASVIASPAVSSTITGPSGAVVEVVSNLSQHAGAVIGPKTCRAARDWREQCLLIEVLVHGRGGAVDE